jgi:glycosyltransferase A (GT-A) superfamily protein (DUF2064 family)
VFVPAEDGGYVLVGAQHISRAAFDGIPWGSATVMQRSRDKLMELGWSWSECPTLWDIDRPGDLDRLQQSGFAHLLPGAATEAA